MMQTLVKNRWLLALAGVFDVVISIVYFDHAGHGFHVMRDVFFVGRITIAAGMCTIVAGLWSAARRQCWPLVLNGVALAVLGCSSMACSA